jgi:hypothetical protein
VPGRRLAERRQPRIQTVPDARPVLVEDSELGRIAYAACPGDLVFSQHPLVARAQLADSGLAAGLVASVMISTRTAPLSKAWPNSKRLQAGFNRPPRTAG